MATGLGWPEVSEHVRAVVRAMSTDERELVTFRIVHAKVIETRIVSEEVVLKHKKAIKELVVEEIEALRGEAEDDGSDTERLDSKTPVLSCMLILFWAAARATSAQSGSVTRFSFAFARSTHVVRRPLQGGLTRLSVLMRSLLVSCRQRESCFRSESGDTKLRDRSSMTRTRTARRRERK
jgi:hypothetical protein